MIISRFAYCFNIFIENLTVDRRTSFLHRIASFQDTAWIREVAWRQREKIFALRRLFPFRLMEHVLSSSDVIRAMIWTEREPNRRWGRNQELVVFLMMQIGVAFIFGRAASWLIADRKSFLFPYFLRLCQRQWRYLWKLRICQFASCIWVAVGWKLCCTVNGNLEMRISYCLRRW